MDFSHHLSREAKRRQASIAKALYPIVAIPGMKSLGGGLPDSKLFPLLRATYDVVLPPDHDSDAVHTDHVSLITGQDAKGQQSVIDLGLAQQYIAGSGFPELISLLEQLTDIVHRPPSQANHKVGATLGNTDGVAKMMRTLLNPGDNMLFEEFSYSLSVENARAVGVGLVPVPMDEFGTVPEELELILDQWDANSLGPKPRVFYLVPVGQNPTGTTMPMERLQQIYAIAQKHDLILFEDDPYYFLQLGPYQSTAGSGHQQTPSAGIAGSPPSTVTMQTMLDTLVKSLLSIDVDGRVVRFDSFSKIVFPGSRSGWVTMNPLFHERFERISEVTTQNGQGIGQAFFTQLLTAGSKGGSPGSWGFDGLAKWINRARQVYAKKRDVFLHSLERECPQELGLLTYGGPEAGMFVWMRVNVERHPRFAKDLSSTPQTNTAALMEELFNLCVANGCVVLTGKFFTVQHTLPPDFSSIGLSPFGDMRDRENYLRATFAGNTEVMDEAIKRLGKSVKQFFGLEAPTNTHVAEANGHV